MLVRTQVSLCLLENLDVYLGLLCIHDVGCCEDVSVVEMVAAWFYLTACMSGMELPEFWGGAAA